MREDKTTVPLHNKGRIIFPKTFKGTGNGGPLGNMFQKPVKPYLHDLSSGAFICGGGYKEMSDIGGAGEDGSIRSWCSSFSLK